MKTKFYPKVDAGEIIYNYFDCPSCLMHRAPTSIYYDIRELDPDDFIFECENCETKFTFITAKQLENQEFEIERQS